MTTEYQGRVVVVDHPLVQHKLSILRDEATSSRDFRTLVKELAMLETYEATKELALCDVQVKTPICETTCRQVEKRIVIVPILRAGLGMMEGVQEFIPQAAVGHLGMYRDPETHEPHEYYAKMPEGIEDAEVLLVDPMLATGGSANASITYLRNAGVKNITLMVMVAAPVGVQAVLDHDADVRVFTCSIDEKLNEDAYIVPGLGDAGDRIFGTK